MKNMICTELSCDELSLISGGINQRKVIVTLSEITGTLLGSILTCVISAVIINYGPDADKITSLGIVGYGAGCISIVAGGCFVGYRLGEFVGNKIANKVLAKK